MSRNFGREISQTSVDRMHLLPPKTGAADVQVEISSVKNFVSGRTYVEVCGLLEGSKRPADPRSKLNSR